MKLSSLSSYPRCWLLLRMACYSWGGEAGVTTAAAAAEWVSACSRLPVVVPVLMCLRLNCTLTMVDIYGFARKTIRLTGNVLMHCYANKRDYSIKRKAIKRKITATRMWANPQRDGRPAKYRWCPALNAAKFGSRPLFDCRAVTLPIGERKTWRTQSEFCTWQNSVTEQQPPKMYIVYQLR